MEKVFYALLGFLFCPSALLVKPFDFSYQVKQREEATLANNMGFLILANRDGQPLLDAHQRSRLGGSREVHFHPLQLNLTEGETAKFTCSISNPDLGKHLDWYKQGHDHQPVKLDGSSRKYSFAKRDDCRYEMEILQVEKNDSGTYYCWVNPFHSEGTMLESNRSSLIVTENVAATQPPDEIAGVKEQDEGVRKDTKSSFSNLRGSGLFILLVVLYFSVWWIIRRRRQKQKEQKHGNAPLEEVDPPAVTVFTVDYEMLAFPGGPKTKPAASPKPVQREPTEYATIVFLPKTPEAAEEGDSKQPPCPVCVQQP